MGRPYLDRQHTGYDKDVRILLRVRAGITADSRWSREKLKRLVTALDVVTEELRDPQFQSPEDNG